MTKKFIVYLSAFIYLLQATVGTMAATDRDILSDPVANVYTADLTGQAISNNLNFTDVPITHWAKEPITRLGALSVVKGYNEENVLSYRPDANVSNEEALAFILRLIGQEEAAVLASKNIANNPDDPTLTIWSNGYLQVANNLGLITVAELTDGLTLDQTVLDPELNWLRRAPVTREQVALWLVQGVNASGVGNIAPIDVHQQVFALDDWETIDPAYLSYVEALMEAGIMVGDGTSFNPKEPLSRGEMAQIVVNMEDVLYETMGLTLKGGVVGSVANAAAIGVLATEQLRTYLIRNDGGLVDQIDLVYSEDSQKKLSNKDVPVLTRAGVEGLAALQEGDYIQYLVDDATKEMKYISSAGTGTPVKVKGLLQPLTDLANGKISVKNDTNMVFTYQMIDGIYNPEEATIELSNVSYPVALAPIANTVTLTIQNKLVTTIDYDGAAPLSMEISGIIKEVNEDFSFITIEGWNGGEVTKYFNADVVVEKENYYDTEDEIGYIDEMFPYYGFDERDAQVGALEVGDIVHLKLNPTNLQYVTDISAKTNYSVKFGEITEIASYGANGLTMRIAYDDQSIGALDVDALTPVLLRDKNLGVGGLKEGQLVKVLLNQAVLSPGRTVESVKQIDVDPYGNMAETMYKGELGIYNKAEQSLSLLNSYALTTIGWAGFDQMTSIDLSDDGVEVYYDGQRVSLDYADEFLRQEGMTVYGVTENDFGQEKLSRLILGKGRGDVLASTNVSYSDGYSQIRLVNSPDNIAMDQGTIVVKNGHIVSANSILSPDYAQVVLGDEGNAVMVKVVQEPNNDALTVMRGRIDSIDDGQQFNVESNALLKGMEWIYSPVEREFRLAYDTVIIDENGRQSLDEFIDYSELSKVDEVYTIIADGTKATHLFKNTYATEGVQGTIYNQDDTKVYIRDAFVYESDTKLWETLSLTNNYAEIELLTETVIIKNNQVIEADDLAAGDQIRVFVTDNLSEELKLNNNRTVSGYIIFVE